MQRRKTPFLLLLVCLLLCACGAPAAPAPSEPPAEAASSPTPPASAEEALPSPAAMDAETVPEAAGQVESGTELISLLEAAPDPEPYDGPRGIFPLLEREDVTLQLLITQNPEQYRGEAYLRLMRVEEEGINYEVSDVLLNGSIRLDQSFTVWSRETERLSELDIDFLTAECLLSLDDLHSIRCHVKKYTWAEDGWTRVVIWEEDCEASIPEGFHPDILFLPILGADVPAQLLCDEGGIRVSLLGMGEPSWDKDGTLGFLLRIENDGESSAPFAVNGISVNGSLIQFHNENRFKLQPGTVCYTYESSYYDSLREIGITEIQDLALLLLTNEMDNTGTMNWDGGRWYTVDLNSENLEETRPEITDPLFENDWVRIQIVDYSETTYSDNSRHFTWRLVVENRSDTDLDLSCFREDDSDSFRTDDRPYYYISDGEIRAGGWRYMNLKLSVPEGMTPPLLSIRFMGQTLGGGRLLFLEKEPIDIPFEDQNA